MSEAAFNKIAEGLNAILAELKAIRRILDRDAGADAIVRGFPNGPPPTTAEQSVSPYATVAHASHLEQRRSQPRIVTQNGIKDSGSQG